MRVQKTLKSRLMTGLFSGSLFFGFGWSTALSAPIELEFRPPEIEVTRICTPKRPDTEIEKDWSSWSGTSLPAGQSKETIARDLVRLRDIDAAKNFDTIMAGLELMKKSDPSYSDSRYLIDRINVYIKSGRIEDLKNARLVEELQASGYTASPRAMDFLSDLYLSGIVVRQDAELGLKLKVQAAYGGNANALLHLAALTSNDEQVPGWTVDAPVAVTLAFGSLLGKLNPTICDRIGRIAREYASGEVVEEDHALAETWYRFAADLGDTNAAWKVAEYHLDSEFIEKNNELLLTYLTQAADAEVVSAQIELGRIYETGALTQKDAEAALRIYDKLASSGLRVGFIRSILLREKLGHATGPNQAEYAALLKQLAELPEAPGWVFTKLGKQAQAEKGVWESAALAEGHFQQAASLGDVDGKYELAKTYLRSSSNREKYNAALDLLYSAVSENGKIEALSELRRAHLCLNPDGPDIATEAYWRKAEIGAGNETIALNNGDEFSADGGLPPMLHAEIQTQALYGRAEALGNYVTLLKEGLVNASPDALAFWEDYARRYAGGDTSIAVRSYEVAESDTDKSTAIEELRRLSKGGDVQATVELANILLVDSSDNQEAVAEAEHLLTTVREGARGKILRMLAGSQNDAGAAVHAVSEEKARMISDFGDADALLFLAGTADTVDDRQTLYQRARGLMRCNFDTVYQFAEFSSQHGYEEELDRWLDVMMALLEGKAWQAVKVADLYSQRPSASAQKAAFDLYVGAHEKGYQIASYRLLDLVSDPQAATYDPALGREIFATLLERADGNQLYGVIRRVQKSPAEIQEPVLAQFDIRSLYRRAAEAEYPAAMRELAKLMRTSTATREEIREASEWLKKSAAAEDVEAMVLLAQAYAFGIGLDPSRRDAVKWLQAASESGDEAAANLLEIIQLQ